MPNLTRFPRAGLLALATVIFSLLGAPQAQAIVKREFTDLKLPTQVLMERQTILNAIAAETVSILTPNVGPTSAAVVTITTFAGQPDVPRNLVITPSHTTGAVGTCVITVVGTNIFGASISETFAFSANASSATTGAKAFKTVSSVSWAADCEDTAFDARWSIGVGEKLGLNKCLDFAGNVVFATASGVYEATRATCVADADEVEKNTCDVNATMDAAADFQLFFIQNFRCQR